MCAVDSTPATPLRSTVLSSPGAEGVASKYSDDDGGESSGGSRSLGSVTGGGGGGGGKENVSSTHNATAVATAGAGADGSIVGVEVGKADPGGSMQNGHGHELIRPPSPMSGGHAATQA